MDSDLGDPRVRAMYRTNVRRPKSAEKRIVDLLAMKHGQNVE